MFSPSDSMNAKYTQQQSSELKRYISPNYCIDENAYVEKLLLLATPDDADLKSISLDSSLLIEHVRAHHDAVHLLDKLLLEYSLDTQEGVLLMCLAEALLRIPDAATADALIFDRLSIADWEKHLHRSESLLVNAATWGLMLTGRVVALDHHLDGTAASTIEKLIKRLGESVTRKAMNKTMAIMGGHFVLGRDIDEAIRNAQRNVEKGYQYSFDMLGDAALSRTDAEQYHEKYRQAIVRLGQNGISHNPNNANLPMYQPASVSIKLSALHPRYEESQRKRVMSELYQTVLVLVAEAKQLNVGITIDAEEMDRLELYIDLFEKLYQSRELKGWGKLGVVIQAYSKRALPILVWIAALAREQGDIIPVRLVKGAYWDSEIKQAQQLGLNDYPVFTRKESTDVSYLVCARFLFSDAAHPFIYPQFATHNAHTVACIKRLAISSNVTHAHYEFQRLHGMGDALYSVVLSKQKETKVRIYAPVGAHAELLPYLVRRLLENGANSSFVHRLVDANTPISELVLHPCKLLSTRSTMREERIPLPSDIFGKKRRNSVGINLNISAQYTALRLEIDQFMTQKWWGEVVRNEEVGRNEDAATLSTNERLHGECVDVFNPCDASKITGMLIRANQEDTELAIQLAVSHFESWNNTPVNDRATCLENMASILEANTAELIALCHREAGKTLQDSVDEIREAVDFCRYYASQSRRYLMHDKEMPGPTGESNHFYHSGRGVFACISPWNFPLAIFVGQISAALVAGNTVIAKPAEQASLMACRAVELWYEAGIPRGVLRLLPGEGVEIGDALVNDERIAGVVFTGSNETAQTINRNLANRPGPIVPLIAETGGQNAMIVDSTALPEQVVRDVIDSAFRSAGQRCSALRVLYLQEEVAPRILTLLKGAMAELTLGDPSLLETDIGPVIDQKAKQMLHQHIEKMNQEAILIFETSLPESLAEGYFVAPIAYQINHIKQLNKEHFGPVLHVITFPANGLEEVVEQINQSGYGLTLGIHSRNETTARYIDRHVHVGNVYINRNQIGATVGVQPFGGQGLSGTGPKAGGPGYLFRFTTERTRTVNTSALGGNTSLLSLSKD